MKKVITLVLLVAGILLTVKGIDTLRAATASADILGIEISASDESGQAAGITYLLLGLAGLAASYFSWKK